MGQTSNTDQWGLDALTAGNAGSAKTPIPNDGVNGCKLANGTTYYFSLDGVSNATLEHVTAKWDANIIVTLSLECTSIPAKLRNSDTDDLKAWDNTAGNGWNQEPLTSTAASLTDTTGAVGNASIASNTVIVAGGTAGSMSMHVGNLGSRRARIKAAVQGTGGALRICMAGKQ